MRCSPPAALVTLAIAFLPMLQTAWMSLHDYVLFRPNDLTWVRLDNLKAALADEVCWISLKHTIIWMCTTIPAQLALGLITALLLMGVVVVYLRRTGKAVS
ncbi:hypothetical protein Q4543_14380 [Salipiger sp. 1_MG-2023]|uniref:hypothetical protein n=1 Tax=Salipiger sp. 1_MG-2023 TaxID=3062665 RepID=UPI0026E22382|nr:hypothetical protein [Salipiger sp. 1_MG-2023]MDO6586699.1 hypothetical protein [Salipiger sp. 1_MG-2023]